MCERGLSATSCFGGRCSSQRSTPARRKDREKERKRKRERRECEHPSPAQQHRGRENTAQRMCVMRARVCMYSCGGYVARCYRARCLGVYGFRRSVSQPCHHPCDHATCSCLKPFSGSRPLRFPGGAPLRRVKSCVCLQRWAELSAPLRRGTVR